VHCGAGRDAGMVFVLMVLQGRTHELPLPTVCLGSLSALLRTHSLYTVSNTQYIRRWARNPDGPGFLPAEGVYPWKVMFSGTAVTKAGMLVYTTVYGVSATWVPQEV
jgi:hypothetical protein